MDNRNTDCIVESLTKEKGEKLRWSVAEVNRLHADWNEDVEKKGRAAFVILTSRGWDSSWRCGVPCSRDLSHSSSQWVRLTDARVDLSVWCTRYVRLLAETDSRRFGGCVILRGSRGIPRFRCVVVARVARWYPSISKHLIRSSIDAWVTLAVLATMIRVMWSSFLGLAFPLQTRGGRDWFSGLLREFEI